MVGSREIEMWTLGASELLHIFLIHTHCGVGDVVVEVQLVVEKFHFYTVHVVVTHPTLATSSIMRYLYTLLHSLVLVESSWGTCSRRVVWRR